MSFLCHKLVTMLGGDFHFEHISKLAPAIDQGMLEILLTVFLISYTHFPGIVEWAWCL